MIDRIAIKNVLPHVFKNMESDVATARSSVWHREVIFERGCRICIQAESGSGKSSLLSYIYGERRDYDGEILFDGCDSRTFDVDKWCSLRTHALSLLPQELRLFAGLTVMQNIQLKNQLTNHKTEGQIRQLLEQMGIADKADCKVEKLSFGQQQRVAIIRALCQPFDFILLDEPVSHLDHANNKLVADAIETEAQFNGAGIISTSVGNPLAIGNAVTIKL